VTIQYVSAVAHNHGAARCFVLVLPLVVVVVASAAVNLTNNSQTLQYPPYLLAEELLHYPLRHTPTPLPPPTPNPPPHEPARINTAFIKVVNTVTQ